MNPRPRLLHEDLFYVPASRVHERRIKGSIFKGPKLAMSRARRSSTARWRCWPMRSRFAESRNGFPIFVGFNLKHVLAKTTLT